MSSGGDGLGGLRRDLRYAARGLRRAPGFTLIAVPTIALGVGANTAIFSVLHAVLIAPLPFRHSEQLVSLYQYVPPFKPGDAPRRVGSIDVREWLALRDRARTLSHVTARGFALVSVVGDPDGHQRELTSVTASTFPMLGVSPLFGRWIQPDDEPAGNVILLSYRAWRRYFNGDPGALGRTLMFASNAFSQGTSVGTSYTVIGVMPADFHFPDDDTEFWTPMAITPPADARQRRAVTMARLADGASIEAATTEITTIARDLRGNQPGAPANALHFEVTRAQDEVGDSVRPALTVLTAAVGFVLLVACANVASLLLARMTGRAHELAVRSALGAGQGRIVRQLLTESVLLSLLGGAAGMVFAAGGVALFRSLATNLARIDLGSFSNGFPRLDSIGVSAPVFGFAIAVSVATGLIFGLVPAIRHGRQDHMAVLRGTQTTSRGASVRGRAVQGMLVVLEIALATTLSIGGGLLLHSLVKLTSVNPGFEPDHVLTFQVALPGPRRQPADLIAFAEGTVAQLRSLPGVQSAGYANQLPMVALENSQALRTSLNQPVQIPSPNPVDVRLVSSGYMTTMRMPIVAGRPFGETDAAGHPHVMIVNRTLARRDFPVSPVGATVYIGRDPLPWEIVGVVADVRQQGLDREPRPQFFVNMPQWPGPGVPVFPLGAYYAVLSTVPPKVLMPQIRARITAAASGAAIENVATMDQIMSNGVSRPRMYAVLLGTFAAVAVGLAAAGIYGVILYSVTARTRELGLRMALGARRVDVCGLVLRQGAILTVAGLILGLGGAIAATRYLETLLFGLTPLDAVTFASVVLFFAAVAAGASLVPAVRATRVDPLIALRHE